MTQPADQKCPKIVAFLQNQWFKHPEKMRRTLEVAMKGDRERFVRTFLFFGCTTGQRLERALGDWCDRIVWENASPEIGGQSASSFPADLAHIGAVIRKHQPTHVIAFGATAREAIQKIQQPTWKLIIAPHPAARQPDVPQRLRMLCEQLDALEAAGVTP